MSNFIYNSYCVEHPGVVRIYQASDERMAAIAAEHEAQSQSRSHWMVLAALAAGVFQATETWSDGHMMAAWMVLWAMAFASIALFSQPARRAINLVRTGYRAWVKSRQQAAADERVWNAALQDARLMADLARAMDRQSR
ncbi:hypothetical protein O987_00340 [Comamonas testosteroni TK102]|uniref:Uncharacterized protein n=1 Tax=Comamonas testosteroni TK102 TaxID=1392005 RepID=A0A076PF24_COMTE|nr:MULTISPECIES: hypothetical protein [Comamonas]AIJ44268.1 hypothetical protein O987_00340 [Comamonas testosteroni TK102]MPS89947.1 hypothetical protein [Comamonas sp.]